MVQDTKFIKTSTNNLSYKLFVKSEFKNLRLIVKSIHSYFV